MTRPVRKYAAVVDLKGVVSVPEQARISGPWLEWTGQTTINVTGPAALDAFIRLANASDDAIARYARHFGVMLFDDDWYGGGGPIPGADDLPRVVDLDGQTRFVLKADYADPANEPEWERFDQLAADERERSVIWYREPIESWRSWSRLVGAVRTLVGELRLCKHRGEARIFERNLVPLENPGKGCAAEYLENLHRFVYREPTVDRQWDQLVNYLNWEVLVVTKVLVHSMRPVLAGPIDAPHVTFGYWQDRREVIESALSQVMAALLNEITAPDGARLNRCVEPTCQRVYATERVRKNGRCADCRKAAAARAAANYRARKKAAAASPAGLDDRSLTLAPRPDASDIVS